MREPEIGVRTEKPAPQNADRRRNRRAKVSMPVLCRPADPKYDEEVRTTSNASRDGLYFTTWADHYYIGMHIDATFPYASVDPCRVEYVGEVVRIERLKDGRFGVAIRFLLR